MDKKKQKTSVLTLVKTLSRRGQVCTHKKKSKARYQCENQSTFIFPLMQNLA
jgi:hypothetical protein